ncbi:MAG: PEGA domain-containing protein [Candidatus Omnitrophica bacterium]|nr:PEGA domain-containing protein [Candidatus Omnitrophota bacterium]
MQLLRKIIFYIFAVIYVSTCPLLILYAFGYIYNPQAREGYSKTGLIYLSSAPSGAEIFVTGTSCDKTTPAAVRELLPGEYGVELRLEGYRPWARTVPVEEEKATVLDSVLLIPDKWQSRRILADEFNDLVPIPKSGFFLAEEGRTPGNIHVCDYRRERAWTLIDAGSPFKEARVVDIFTERASSMVVARVKLDRSERFLWIDFADGSNTVKDITALLPADPDRIRWQASDENTLYVLRENAVKKVDVSSEAVYPEFAIGVKGFGLSEDGVYLLNEDNTIIEVDSDGKRLRKVLEDFDLGGMLFGRGEAFDIYVLSREFLVFTGERGQLISNRLPYRFVPEGVRGIRFDSGTKRLLVWQKERIGILDFTAERTGGEGFEKGPKLAWIYSKGRDIRQCFWVYGASHILFSDGAQLKLLATESYGEFFLNEVFRVKEGTAVYYSEEAGKMYFLDSPDGALRSVEILPEKGLIKAPFPEITGSKKKTKLEELWSSDSQGTT